MASDPLTPLAFSVFENPGVYALLLGSGVSRAADIPTGWEVTLDLVRRAALVEGVAEQADWAAWHREVRGEDPDYSALLAELATSPGDRRAMLHGFIEPSADDLEAGRRVPTAAHRAIARLVADGFIRVIVTTNFDRLLEAALHDVGVTPTVIGSVDALKGAEPLIHARCTILKVHGDYLDARILNTNDELLTYPPEIDGLLDRILDDHGLIVAGWSGEWDHALRAALLRTPNRRYSLYWANRGAPASAAQALIDHRGGRVLTVQSADAFFSGLAERVETLRQIRRVDPLSLDLLVASTKRHLPRPEERIQLEALFAEEVQRLSERLAGAELGVNRTWSDTEFRRQVTVYEASVETLASMMGVLGRWGDGSETSLAFDVVKLLAGRAHRERSGVEAYIGLQAYPAVLAYTAYGLGAARAGRWEVVHDLFNLRLPRPYESDERLVETLFLWSWSHLPSDTWKSLEGLQDRKTPLSDHLLAVFQVWAPRFLGLTASFELEYERFELMGSLAHLERYSLDSVKTSLADGKDWHWLPVGRTGWNSTDRSRLFEELGGPLRPRLLTAGFAHGSAEFLEAFKTTYGRASRRMSF